MSITRRSLALVVACAAAGALTLAGCASAPGDETSGAGQTLRVLTGVDTVYPDEQRAWQKSMATTFHETTGATLEFETYSSANEELTKIQTSVVSGQGPDVYSIGSTFTPTAYSTGAFVTLTDDDWAKVGGRDRFVPATLGISGPSEADEIGVPFSSRPFVMAYNTKLLEAAGIDEPATTWSGLAAQARTLTKGDIYGIATGYADGFDVWKFVWAMAEQAGSPLVDDTVHPDSVAHLDSEAMRAAYRAYFGWITDDGVVDPAAVGWNNSQALAAFASGKAAFFPMTTATSAITLDRSAVADDYAYAVMPTVPPGADTRPIDGVDAASILSGDNLVVASYSKNHDLALAYIKQVTEKDQQLEFYTTFGQLPTNASAAAALENDEPRLAPLVDAAQRSVATPFTGAWGDIQLALTDVTVQSIPALTTGSISDAAIDKHLTVAQAAAQTALKRAK